MKQQIQSSHLDPSFGESGLVVFPLPGPPRYSPGVLVTLSSGQLLVVADFSLTRLNVDGTPDRSFGADGVIDMNLEGLTLNQVEGVCLLADGGWLISAFFYTDCNSGPIVFRLRADGTLEEAFGENGIVFLRNLVSVEGGSVTGLPGRKAPQTNAQAGGVSVIEQPDGKIVLIVSDLFNPQSLVMRLTATGALDTGFNGSGWVIIELPDHEWYEAKAVALQANGHILVCGTYVTPGGMVQGGFVARLDQQGRADHTFNNTGIVLVADRDMGFAILQSFAVLERDSEVVMIMAVGDVTMNGFPKGMAIALNGSGSFNLVFNDGKPLISDMLTEGVSWTHCAFHDEKIIVAGKSGPWGVTADGGGVTARLLADGSLDMTFNEKGWAAFKFDEGLTELRGATVTEDGKTVLSGSLHHWEHPGFGWMARFLA
ncbi:hypothetical protein [Pseudomonas sp. 6D_7.1_Bac1]|uniref:hypothetical protein n=1 Tax=Pseudomonas sp. 6D_7.1_Bac1 TaxID=2971615 RepID=UPI0021C8AF3D|nr:hypothetical protein [Pseudomonas sp. 6D_7.1_Bac1]MCU1749383.1 hypothetical protein [Pseudomonas sp. 6D_7.1_Bac1]